MIELYEYLVKNNVTVATAESCTGGMIASEFISYPGISGVFLAGFVTYANEAKEKLLGVKSSYAEKIEAAINSTEKVFPENASVACQGVEGAYSQIACEKMFKNPFILYFKNFL